MQLLRIVQRGIGPWNILEKTCTSVNICVQREAEVSFAKGRLAEAMPGFKRMPSLDLLDRVARALKRKLGISLQS